ncbi:hypothetical protein [Fibrobacter sp.]|uniref:hypothetical protein n=1 Tax=Fibrobacter sp. TaxID=35828 RepID=UPI003890E5CE
MTLFVEDELDCFVSLAMTLLDDELDGFTSLPMALLDDELDSSSLSLLRMTLADEDELSSSTAIQEPSLQMCSTSLSAGFIIIPSLVTLQGISELRESELFSFDGEVELSPPQETMPTAVVQKAKAIRLLEKEGRKEGRKEGLFS